MRFKALACLCLLAAAWVMPAAAQTADDAEERRMMSSAAFLSGHPDLRYRLAGLQRYRKNDFDGAMVRFRRAARYGDKPSQAMVGEMYWNGQGVAPDKVLGYVWMDLAAERLYPLMLAKRERYWSELDEAARARALEIGQQVYAEYGDDVAKARLDRELRFAKRNTTGSRVGSVGALQIVIPTPGGSEVIDGSKFYDEKFWDVDQYLQWQDDDWINNAEGTVDVGDVMSIETPLPEDFDDEE